MKSIKNLTRLTYETAAFQGWRLAIRRSGAAFAKYFSDKQHGSEKKSFAAGQAALTAVKAILDGAKLVNGKHTPATIRKVEKLLEQA
ncbi:MAG: hypothetical protein NTW21_39415 [Verrucomicrobia bacterium]|nr:hypothetical protein [Verrucomicrobiota bacterium]